MNFMISTVFNLSHLKQYHPSLGARERNVKYGALPPFALKWITAGDSHRQPLSALDYDGESGWKEVINIFDSSLQLPTYPLGGLIHAMRFPFIIHEAAEAGRSAKGKKEF
jgi:hypothetical protein